MTYSEYCVSQAKRIGWDVDGMAFYRWLIMRTAGCLDPISIQQGYEIPERVIYQAAHELQKPDILRKYTNGT